MRKRAALLLLLPALSACHPVRPPAPTAVDFQSDPQILRGRWGGQIALDPGGPVILGLELNAYNPTDYSYRVGGTGTLGTQSLQVEGNVFVGYHQKLVRPQTSPIPQGVQLRLVGGQLTGSVFCPQVQIVGAQPVWKCNYSSGTTAQQFDLQRSQP